MSSERIPVSTPGLALRQHPLTLLGTSWPWRSLVYLLTTPVIAGVWLLTCWPLLSLAGVPLGRVERSRLRWVDAAHVASTHTPPERAGLRKWIAHRAREAATWSEFLYGVLLLPLSLLGFALATIALGLPAALIATSTLLIVFALLGVDPATVDPTSTAIHENIPAQVGFLVLGAALFLVGLYLVTLATEGQRYLARLLIAGGRDELTEQLHEVARSRARISTAFDSERRRIERDLHDGVQQRLTALVISLGTMRYQHARGHDITPHLDKTAADAQRAVDELRDIVHGIYPAALRDRDLADAIDDLAFGAENPSLTVKVSIDLSEVSLTAETETAVYFAVSELLTNVQKHSHATTVTLTAEHRPATSTLHVAVEDDGFGGAQAGVGTGLLGVRDRIEALGGLVTVTSPHGGPTRITLEVPCAS